MAKNNVVPWLIVAILVLILISSATNIDIPFLSWFKGTKTVEKVVTQHDSIINRDTVRIKEAIIVPRYYRIVKNDTLYDTTFFPIVHNDTIQTLPFVAVLDTVVKKDSFYVEFHYPAVAFKNILASHKPDTITVPQIQYITTENRVPAWFFVATYVAAFGTGVYLGAKLTK